MNKDDDLTLIDFTAAERDTLPLNHRTTYTKEIPSAAAYTRARLVNQKYKHVLNLAAASRKPISKVGIKKHEDS